MKRIAEKSKLINLPPAGAGLVERSAEPASTPTVIAPMAGVVGHGATPPAPPTPAAAHAPSRSFTGVGAMMASLGQGGTLGRELEEVKARLAQLEGEGVVPVRLIDPKLIDQSSFANRHGSEYRSEAFLELKREIEQARVNVQPIKVRPASISGRFEIVFGHRRHRACLDLGLEVLALVESVSDRNLWLQMDQENRGRRDLSPWEQGRSIQNALAHGLFPSVRQLAENAGIDHSNAAKLLKLAELPDDVVAAFERPTDLQVHWAGLLSKALQSDPDSVLGRARGIQARGTVPRAPKGVLAELLGETPAPTGQGADKPITLTRDGVTLATVKQGAGRRVLIEVHQVVSLQDTAREVARWLGVASPADR